MIQEEDWRVDDDSNAVDSNWNVMAYGDAREGKWRGNWRMGWLANTLHPISGHGVSSITTADAHNSAASSRLNWRPRRFKWTRPFRRKTKSGFCACAITFQTRCTIGCGHSKIGAPLLSCRVKGSKHNSLPATTGQLSSRAAAGKSEEWPVPRQ